MWQNEGAKLLPGDSVCEALHDYFLDIVYPTFMSSSVLQVGEAYDTDATGRNRYLTFQRDLGVWRVAGYRTVRDFVEFVSSVKPAPGDTVSFLAAENCSYSRTYIGESYSHSDYGIVEHPVTSEVTVVLLSKLTVVS
jgi:hypothetical protein